MELLTDLHCSKEVSPSVSKMNNHSQFLERRGFDDLSMSVSYLEAIRLSVYGYESPSPERKNRHSAVIADVHLVGAV